MKIAGSPIDQTILRLVRRQIILLIILSTLAGALFFFTRALAVRNRQMNAEIATAWYRMGQDQLAGNDTTAAIVSLRNAATRQPGRAEYTLALAVALTKVDQGAEARQILLRLRELTPEDGETNMHLARVVAEEGDVSEAIRYYRNALYGVWPEAEIETQRRQVRTELVRFLLDRQETSQALSELLILRSDVPESPTAQVEVGKLWLQAGDAARALEQFRTALGLDPNDVEALTGAGSAAFELRDYATTRQYLEAALETGAASPEAGDLLEVVRLVLTNDPLGPRLSTALRIRRFRAIFDHTTARIENCLAERTAAPDVRASVLNILSALQVEAQVMEDQVRPSDLRQDPELIRSGVNLIYRIELAARQICGAATPLDRALLLIGRRYAETEQ